MKGLKWRVILKPDIYKYYYNNTLYFYTSDMKCFHKHVTLFESHNPRSRHGFSLLTVRKLKFWEARWLLSEVTQLSLSLLTLYLIHLLVYPTAFLIRGSRVFTVTFYQLLHSIMERNSMIQEEGLGLDPLSSNCSAGASCRPLLTRVYF